MNSLPDYSNPMKSANKNLRSKFTGDTLKLTYKQLSGLEFTVEFENVSEFIRVQSGDLSEIADNHKVVAVEIDGSPYDFTGTVGELYFALLVKK